MKTYSAKITPRSITATTMTVGSDHRFIAYGSVRGLVAEADTAAEIEKAVKRDVYGCRKQGGYSDAQPYQWDDQAGWVALE